MGKQGIGVLIVSIGIWLVYCATYGVQPLQTFLAIVKDSSSAGQIIEDAKEATSKKYAALFAAIGAPSAATSGATGTAPVTAGNPFPGAKLSDTWAEHRARGSEGGQDFAVPKGTPTPAPFAGKVNEVAGSDGRGYYASVTNADGYVSSYYHLSQLVKELDGKTVAAGTIIGYSGGVPGEPGAGSTTGAHVHWNLLDPQGNNIDPMKWIAGGGK